MMVAGRRRDYLWEAFVAIHGEPATDSERGKYNRIVKELRTALVGPEEYATLVAAYVDKYDGSQPAAATVSQRVGELRHYVMKGPVRKIDIDAEARWAALEAEYEGGTDDTERMA